MEGATVARGHRKAGARILSLAAALLAGGCAPATYHPRPLAPEKTAAAYRERSLSDPGLRTFIESTLKRKETVWPPRTWSLPKLVLAGYYFNPALEITRAQAQVADAAVITAGARPNPSLSVAPGIPSPYLLELDLGFPWQTAGKRSARVQQAQALSSAARLAVGEAAWEVRSQIRRAMVAYVVASQRLTIERSVVSRQAQLMNRLQVRLTAGAEARPAVTAARAAWLEATVAERTAETDVATTRAELAGAIGLPASGLAGVALTWPSFSSPPSPSALTPKLVERDALVNRLDVRAQLAQYAAADAALRLELARQYPNLQIGPGYRFEETDNFVTLGLSLTLPIFNRNQGPIAEAQARRREAGARFLQTQATVITATDNALAQYRGAAGELQQATEALNELQGVTEPATVRAVDVGAVNRLEVDRVDLQVLQATSAQLDALTRVQTALGALEDAVQLPLADGEPTTIPGGH